MPCISDTAYRRLKSNPSAKELNEAFTPTIFELVYAEERARESVRVGLLLLLKTFQRVGYFMPVKEIPAPIIKHVATSAGCSEVPEGLLQYDNSSARRRHMGLATGIPKRSGLGRRQSR